MSAPEKWKERIKEVKEIIERLTKQKNKKLVPQPVVQPYRNKRIF